MRDGGKGGGMERGRISEIINRANSLFFAFLVCFVLYLLPGKLCGHEESFSLAAAAAVMEK